jgi:tetratricopeptide (TPR) repeat protein
MTMSSLARSLVVMSVVALPLDAAADPKLEAQQHLDHAMALFRDNHFTEALPEVMTAYALDPRPDLLYAIGQIHVRLGDCKDAVTFYERFLATKPNAETAALAREAIAACKTHRASVEPPKVEPKPPEPKVEPKPPEPKPPEPQLVPVQLPPPPPVHTQPPWYADWLGDGLVVGGAVSGIAGILVYRSATADRDKADALTSYQPYADLIDSAHRKRAYAIGLGVGGVALVAAGVVHLILHDARIEDRAVAVVPARGGGLVTWTGGF